MGRSIALLCCATVLAACPVSAEAQSMQGMDMKGMDMKGMSMPAKKKPPAKKAVAKPSSSKPAARAGGVKRSSTKAKAPVSGRVMKGMDHSSMPGMTMQHGSPSSSASPTMPGMDMTPEASRPASAGQPMPGMDMSGGHSMPGMDMPGGKPNSDMASMPGMAMTGTALAAGDAPAPAPPMDHYADRLFAGPEMQRARANMMHEQGAQSFYQVMFNLAEVQIRSGRDGYRWDGGAWFGGDINRLRLKTEGEGTFREAVDSAEVQALYSRAIGPYFNLEAGVRQDFRPTPRRTYATVGFEGLAPYQFEVEGAAFLSQKGDILGRLEGYYDQRITQRIILQPRVELNLAAQDVVENRIGAGLTDIELGLRLRYEVAREFAPYIGVSYEAKTGRTADYARADGKDASSTSVVAGVRFWF